MEFVHQKEGFQAVSKLLKLEAPEGGSPKYFVLFLYSIWHNDYEQQTARVEIICSITAQYYTEDDTSSNLILIFYFLLPPANSSIPWC